MATDSKKTGALAEMSYPHGPHIRARSIAEIATGKLHSYSPLYNVPRNPYAYGSLRHMFRTGGTRRNIDSAEQLHLKSEAEIEQEIKTMEQRIEDAKKELQRRKDEKEEDDIETGGAEIG